MQEEWGFAILIYGQNRIYLRITLTYKENERSAMICRLGYKFQMLQIKISKTAVWCG